MESLSESCEYKSENCKITSLELLDQINLFRKQEGNKSELLHKNLLAVIRDEFEESITDKNILPSTYKDSTGRSLVMFELTLPQAKQVFIRMKSKPSKEFCDKHNICFDNVKIVNKVRFEYSFGKLLKEQMKVFGIKMKTQYNVDGHRVDFYFPEHKLAVEYDEAQHLSKTNMIKDKQREDYIKSKIGCEFIRVNYKDTDAVNSAIVLKKILSNK